MTYNNCGGMDKANYEHHVWWMLNEIVGACVDWRMTIIWWMMNEPLLNIKDYGAWFTHNVTRFHNLTSIKKLQFGHTRFYNIIQYFIPSMHHRWFGINVQLQKLLMLGALFAINIRYGTRLYATNVRWNNLILYCLNPWPSTHWCNVKIN